MNAVSQALIELRLLLARWRQRLHEDGFVGAVQRLWSKISRKIEPDKRETIFRLQFDEFRALSAAAGLTPTPEWRDRYPCLDDETTTTAFDRHYIYHPAWAARVLAKTRPPLHVDVSSTLYFCSIVSAFVPVHFYDFRPAPLVLGGLVTGHADLTRLAWPSASIQSLSCMHVIEHIGLGRYGDPLDPLGDRKAVGELVRVLASGGDLLVAVPVGIGRVMFNAHRIYWYEEFLRYFEKLQLVEFALVPDGEANEGLIYAPAPELVNRQSYGCGCFWFRKP